MFKYVLVLDEKWFEDLLEDYEIAFNELSKKLSHFNSQFQELDFFIKATPIKYKGKEYPFPLAVQLRELYNWMTGKARRPKDIESILDDIIHLVWFNPFVDYTEILDVSWEQWAGPTGSYIGIFYRFAHISLKLDRKEAINATDLALISGLSAAAIAKKLRMGEIKGVKAVTGWNIEAVEAKEWLSKREE